jgi:HPt (histidine-containing phosphotransfer) domain-containing protein
MDNEEFYREMLKEYLSSGKAEAMKQYFEAQDWENYRITVHALKEWLSANKVVLKKV